ncbi:MAG: phosphatidylglycerophosphatase A [candidate division Zixibacteria bacterium]|jgi:phosphatidylglycerophosphatase A|nr:phosphatidylglycerophosphatase A [candidate division Zixibacteria bacterium]
MRNTLVIAVATGAYSGYTPMWAGTFGTIPPALISLLLIGNNLPLAMLAAVVTFAVSVWAAGEAERVFGHDSKKIVIDEWAGWFVTMLYVPVSWQHVLIAFVAFRFFDVVKLWPARRLESLPGGWGVTMDDIAAGVQACLATHIVIQLIAWL